MTPTIRLMVLSAVTLGMSSAEGLQGVETWTEQFTIEANDLTSTGISRRTNSVLYFGEDVDMFESGRVVSHEGAWLAGTNGTRFGLTMPGLPLVGARYYQEIAPRVAMDRARIVALSGRLTTTAGTFTDILRIEETTPLERAAREHKLYSPGVGLVQDGSLTLVRYGRGVATP